MSKISVNAKVIATTLISCLKIIWFASRDKERAFKVTRDEWGPRMLTIANSSLSVEGQERVDFSQPHIFVMNHQSLIDIPVSFVALPVPLCFVAKAELSKIPFFGRAMRSLGMIFVDRSNPQRAHESLKSGGALIRAGVNIMAYPEGTRSKDGVIKPFKRGVFQLALEAKVPIVPMAIDGALTVLNPKGTEVQPGHIRVRIGQPIEVRDSQRSPEEDEVELQKLRSEVREAVIKLHHSLIHE